MNKQVIEERIEKLKVELRGYYRDAGCATATNRPDGLIEKAKKNIELTRGKLRALEWVLDVMEDGDNPVRLNKHNTPKCSQCKTKMSRGQYIAQTYQGIGDFHENDAVVTTSAGGKGRIADCWKCRTCGESRL